MKQKDLWISRLKEKLEDFSESAPISSWERLEKELTRLPGEKRIIPLRTYRWAAVAAVILLLVVSSIGLYFLDSPMADEIRHTQASLSAVSPDYLPKQNVPERQGEKITQASRVQKELLAENREKIETLQSDSHWIETGEEKEIPEEEDVLHGKTPDIAEQTTAIEDKSNKNTEANHRERVSEGGAKYSSIEKPSPIFTRKPSKKGKWSTGFSFGNSGGASEEIGIGGIPVHMSRVNMMTIANDLMEIPEGQTLVFEEGVPYLRQSNDAVEMKHHQPISFGVSVRRDLKRGFSVETGVTYTLLSSDAKLPGVERNVEQKLHYIGIPLRANWNFFERKLLTLYVSGGGMVEKCVYGKFGSEKETVKPLQFSVSGAVGAQLNLTRRIGIYAEPGIAYFFNDGSDVQTIRKESPLNFNMQAGLRLTY